MAKNNCFQRIYIEITNRCNLSCDFCPVTSRPTRMLSVEEFEQIARSVSDWTHHICLHVKGEPLMHPQLGELLAIAAHYGLQVNLTTNATLLSEKGHLLLGTHAPRQVSLSLHSFDANTLHWMDFDSYLSQAFDFARQFTSSTNGYISFRLWNLSTDADANQQKQNKYILKKIEQAYQLPEPIDDIRPKSQGNTLAPRTYLNFDYLFDWPDLLAPDFGTDGTCHGLRRQLAILADGSVVPCCLDNEGILTLGNIFSESLADILQKERSLRIIEGFQRRKITEPLCRHCGYRTRF